MENSNMGPAPAAGATLSYGNILQGQRALVTGASSGIGKAVALALAKAGADVVVNWVSGEEAARALVQQIEELGVRAIALRADVSSEAEVEAMFAQAIETFGSLDILINNAGLQKDARFTEMSLEGWNKVIGVNLTGQFLCARAAVREYLRRGRTPSSRALGKVICIPPSRGGSPASRGPAPPAR